MARRIYSDPIVTERAQLAIVDIFEYLRERDPGAAESFLNDMEEQFDKIGRFPESAPIDTDFGDQVRKRVSGNYLVLYTLRDGLIYVLAVQHGRRERRRLAP